jgi:DNA transposition AAA+ family ATPase
MEQVQCKGSGAIPQVPEGLRKELLGKMTRLGLSQRAVSTQIGVSHSALSTWLSGIYKGSSEAVEEKVRQWLDRRREVADSEIPEDERFPTTVETEVYKSVTSALRSCHLKGKIGVVTAASGSGKTRSVKEYVSRNAGVMMIECHHSFPARMVLGAIAASCGIEMHGSIHELLMSVCDRLRGSGRMLVLDEAEHLKPSVLDVVRRLNDWAGIGIVYVGLPRFMASLQSLRRDYEYIWNRVRVRAGIERSTDVEIGDIRKLLERMLPLLDDGVVRVFHARCGGDVRKLEALYYGALKAVRQSGKSMTPALVTAVAKQLEMEVAA